MQAALWALSGQHPGWEFWKQHHRLHNNELVINHKRTLRIYRALALNLPRRLKKCVPARVKQPLVVPATANVCWLLDFISDGLTDWPPVPDVHRARRLQPRTAGRRN